MINTTADPQMEKYYKFRKEIHKLYDHDVNNTAYMDFLANMAGLNIAQMDVGRRITMAYYLLQTYISNAASSVFNRLDQGVSNLISKMYNIL